MAETLAFTRLLNSLIRAHRSLCAATGGNSSHQSSGPHRRHFRAGITGGVRAYRVLPHSAAHALGGEPKSRSADRRDDP